MISVKFVVWMLFNSILLIILIIETNCKHFCQVCISYY